MNSASPKRRGRPPGSNSFAKVKLQDLISMVGENAVIKVSTLWLRENNIGIEQKTNLISIASEPAEPESKISFSVTNFDNSDETASNEWAAEDAWHFLVLVYSTTPLHSTTTMENFSNLVGQDHIKRQLDFYLDSQNSDTRIPFIMMNGAKGLGKTEFCRNFAKALKKPIMEINCSTIKSSNDFFDQIFVPLIMNQEITVLFDECHALPKSLMMTFLTVFNTQGSAVRQFSFNDNIAEFDFNKQTYLFATTDQDKVFAPLKDRFTIIDFKPYTSSEMAQIISKTASWVDFQDDVLDVVADSVRGNARSAVLRSDEILRYCNKNNQSLFGVSDWTELCNLVNIEKNGLRNSEIEVLNILKERGDCTLGMLSSVTGLSRTTLQRDVESFLLKKNFIRIDGTRKITSKGLNALAG